MSEYNRKAGITEFGTAKRGNQKYCHILTEKNCLLNFLGEQEILDAVRFRKRQGKLGDYHRLLTNTVASQPCCFNLFAPLKNRPILASKLFSQFMGKEIQVQHLDIEFTPYVNPLDDRHLSGFPFKGDESLGDQSQFGGTDADVAVFYTYQAGKRGVILIEFKYIEAEFSICSSYRKKDKKQVADICDSAGFYKSLIEPNLEKKIEKPNCGYLQYKNWHLTLPEESKAFDLPSIKQANHCPFRFSLQQLWRNMLLAENVARVRGLDEFHFWVLSPLENKWLWEQKDGEDVKLEFRKLLTPNGNAAFSKKDIKKDVIENLKAQTLDEWERQWISKFEERYLK
jgi:hypothetical protein